MGELQRSPALALRYSKLAAERGVKAAAAAVGYAYATGGGVGEAVLEGPSPAVAVRWLRAALGEVDQSKPAAAGASSVANGDAGMAPEDGQVAVGAAESAGKLESVVSGGCSELARGVSLEDSRSYAGSDLRSVVQPWAYESWGGEVIAGEEGEGYDGDDAADDDTVEEGAEEEGQGPASVVGLRAVSGRGKQQVETVEQAFALLAEAEAEVRRGVKL